MEEGYFFRRVVEMEWRLEREAKIENEGEGGGGGEVVFRDIGRSSSNDASSYYYLLRSGIVTNPIRGRWGEREKDACGKSVLRDKS